MPVNRRTSPLFQDALVDAANVRAAGKLHCAYELRSQKVHCLADAALAPCAQSVQVGTTYATRLGTERERFEDVRTATDTSIDDDFDAISDCIDNAWQHIDCRSGAIQLPAAVIRNDHRGRADVRGQARIVGSHH